MDGYDEENVPFYFNRYIYVALFKCSSIIRLSVVIKYPDFRLKVVHLRMCRLSIRLKPKRNTQTPESTVGNGANKQQHLPRVEITARTGP
jgi:hypothetical protein